MIPSPTPELIVFAFSCFLAGGCTFALVGTAVRLFVRWQLWREVGL